MRISSINSLKRVSDNSQLILMSETIFAKKFTIELLMKYEQRVFEKFQVAPMTTIEMKLLSTKSTTQMFELKKNTTY